jgi:hypothetical protein
MKRASGITSKPSAPRGAGFAVRQLACLVMLLAILVRAAVPAGFMPVFDSDQRVMTVAMCPGHADQTIQIDLDAPGQEEQTTECPFASLASPAMLRQVASAPVTIAWAHPIRFVSAHEDRFTAAHWQPGSPPTGPPTIF